MVVDAGKESRTWFEATDDRAPTPPAEIMISAICMAYPVLFQVVTRVAIPKKYQPSPEFDVAESMFPPTEDL